MATGPDHYRDGEKFLGYANATPAGDVDAIHAQLMFAQVHATLALAAATALNGAGNGLYVADHDSWHRAAGQDPDTYTYPRSAPVAEVDSPPPLKQAHAVLGAVMDAMPADFRAHTWEIATLASEPPCIGIQQGGNQGDAEARRAIRSIAGLLALSYEEAPKLGYILIRAVGEIGGVRVELWDHAAAPEPVEYFDQAEADDVREIEREMAVDAGDDSEALRQEAEDDARAELRRAPDGGSL